MYLISKMFIFSLQKTSILHVPHFKKFTNPRLLIFQKKSSFHLPHFEKNDSFICFMLKDSVPSYTESEGTLSFHFKKYLGPRYLILKKSSFHWFQVQDLHSLTSTKIVLWFTSFTSFQTKSLLYVLQRWFRRNSNFRLPHFEKNHPSNHLVSQNFIPSLASLSHFKELYSLYQNNISAPRGTSFPKKSCFHLPDFTSSCLQLFLIPLFQRNKALRGTSFQRASFPHIKKKSFPHFT